jgi:carbonic anhydrase
MISAKEALARLRDGNLRFASNTISIDSLVSRNQEAGLKSEQKPFAVILGCSDSRVPVEFIFDQGFGALFVIRVAGNVVAPSQIGSVEFAAERFGTRLVVVLGHSKCGAIEATLEHLQSDRQEPSGNLRSIVNRVRPSIEGLLLTELSNNDEALMHAAVRANVRVSADHLRHGSKILEDLIANDGLRIVGADYSIENGMVDFFDGVTEDF